MHPSQYTNQWAAGPSTHNKTYASSLQETDSLFYSYEHLAKIPNADEGLTRLRKMASLVKPIMRKRGWQVRTLTEFLPESPNLLGLNINRGYKICIRLRYNHAPATFLPFEQTVDTMLHELSHIIWGDHDANFHALWDELRNEHETLLLRGFTGEGFLSKGSRLGGGRVPPQSEIRRLARANAEKRRVLQKGSGRRVGGKPVPRGSDIRQVIADAVESRNVIDRGCASGTADAGRLADRASQQTFKTRAEEDDANNRAIAEALLDLMEEEEMRKTMGTFTSPPQLGGGLAWHPEKGLYSADDHPLTPHITEEEQMKWALQESMRGNGQASRNDVPTQFQQLPSYGKRVGRHSENRPDLPPTKRSKSRVDTSNVLRFQNPDALRNASSTHRSEPELIDLTDDSPNIPPHTESDSWTCEICTCINPLQFLACDACAVERPAYLTKAVHTIKRKPVSQTKPRPTAGEHVGWYCRECATFMEHKWWTCSGCGLVKDTS